GSVTAQKKNQAFLKVQAKIDNLTLDELFNCSKKHRRNHIGCGGVSLWKSYFLDSLHKTSFAKRTPCYSSL
ncbi:MAG: hypothetical protein J6Q42_00710, partial [Clostridia bacterium]|nr:hypothetical protein [Clostridia bacterium]